MGRIVGGMSTPPGAAAASRGRENIFTHKFGPLPMWGWLVIATGLLLGWSYYKNKTSTGTTQPSNTTDAAQVPQFVNQTYTTVNPPGAPGTTTAGNVTVPNVVGMTDTAGDAALTAAGFKVKDTNEAKGGSGGSTKITAQSPAGGTQAPQGSTVTVTLGTPTKTPPGKKPPGPPKKKPPAKGGGDKGEG